MTAGSTATGKMIHKQFIRRQLTGSKKQTSIFVLCVALSIVTLAGLRAFGENVNGALLQDAKALHGGDIIIGSNFAFSEPVAETIARFEEAGLVEQTLTYEFYSVVRAGHGDQTLLSNLKLVAPNYPLYGQVELESGETLQQALRPGNVVVEQNLLDRLGLKLGQQLQIGQATLTIQDILHYEPDRPVNFFSLGPRILISSADLEALDLIKEKSRVRYESLLKVQDERDIDRLAAELSAVALPDQEWVETFRTADSGVKRFFDDFLFYLSLIGIFTLLLAGIGIQSSLTALLREQEKTIAVMKTMGATSKFLISHYLIVVAILGMLGMLLGFGLGFMLQTLFPLLFSGFLPPNVVLAISWRTVVYSLFLGFFVVASFTFLPLYRLKDIRPSFVFRKETTRLKRGLPYYLTILAVFLFFAGTILWQIDDLQIGLYFIGGVLVLLLIIALLSELALFALRRRRMKSLAMRQALRGLFRPRNATRSIIITLAASLAVLFAIYLIEQNLDATFIQSYPEDAPNVFFIDIQPDQREEFSRTLGLETDYYPVIRARISSINGEAVVWEQERERDGDNLARTFNLTYRNALMEGEAIIEGSGLNNAEGVGVQVSILDDLREMRDFQLGDVITFNIQGVPLEARVTSVRTRTTESIQPFFNFVFSEEALKNAPQTIFTAARVEPDEVAPLQNRMVAAFPNINVIDVTQTLSTLGELVRRLSRIIRFFTLFSLVAGLLIIVSSVFATRFARTQEAVYFKVLGAKGPFVLKVFTLENLFLGLVSASVALLLSQVGSWLISSLVFDIPYQPFIGASLLLVLITIMLVISVGLLASLSILKQRPISFLREQTEE